VRMLCMNKFGGSCPSARYKGWPTLALQQTSADVSRVLAPCPGRSFRSPCAQIRPRLFCCCTKVKPESETMNSQLPASLAKLAYWLNILAFTTCVTSGVMFILSLLDLGYVILRKVFMSC
jgi:hypothetical protein